MEIEVSIIMPVYNAEKFLSETIDSIVNQSYKEFELIIVNDGSTDNSLLISQKYAALDPRIRIYTTQNKGICAARNLGLEKAKGKFICFSDHDDTFDVTLLEDNINLIKKYKADLVKFNRTEYILKSDHLIAIKKFNQQNLLYSNFDMRDSFYELLNNDLLTFVWNSVFLKELIDKNKLCFDTHFTVGNEDIDFSMNYLKYCRNIIVNNRSYYNHFARVGISTSSIFSLDKIYSSVYLGKKINSFVNDNDIKSSYYNYTYAMTRLVIYPICRNLTDANNSLTFYQKRGYLKNVIRELLTKKNESNCTQKKYGNSIKIRIYRIFFIHSQYNLALIFDKILKNMVSFYRKIKK